MKFINIAKISVCVSVYPTSQDHVCQDITLLLLTFPYFIHPSVAMAKGVGDGGY